VADRHEAHERPFPPRRTRRRVDIERTDRADGQCMERKRDAGEEACGGVLALASVTSFWRLLAITCSGANDFLGRTLFLRFQIEFLTQRGPGRAGHVRSSYPNGPV
jgi:hypothetical protein